MKIPDKKMREAGMSWSKVAFIKDLAQKVISRELQFDLILCHWSHSSLTGFTLLVKKIIIHIYILL